MPIYTEFQLYRVHNTVLVWAAGQVFTKQNIGYLEAWAGAGGSVA